MKTQQESVTPQVVAKYFLNKSSLTPKKIQKLVYYAYAWFIALNNQDGNDVSNRLFDEKPEAWLHGPVFPTLYAEYKSFGWSEVPKEKKKIKLSKELSAFLDEIWEVFGEYTADQLEYMTHQESPWIKARDGASVTSPSKAEISDKEIFIYYNELAQKEKS